jgi:hypothetical protein
VSSTEPFQSTDRLPPPPWPPPRRASVPLGAGTPQAGRRPRHGPPACESDGRTLGPDTPGRLRWCHGTARRGVGRGACPQDARAKRRASRGVQRETRCPGGKLGNRCGAEQGRGWCHSDADARAQPDQGQRSRVCGEPVGHEGGGRTGAESTHMAHRRPQWQGAEQRRGLTLGRLWHAFLTALASNAGAEPRPKAGAKRRL